MEELIKRVQRSESTLSKWRNDYSSQEWQDASSLNAYFFGLPLNKSKGCECIEDLFIHLKYVNIQSIITMESNRKFELKEGIVIPLHGCRPVSSKSPEEALIALLKASPAHIKFFTKYPDNWEEVISGKADKKQTAEKPAEASNIGATEAKAEQPAANDPEQSAAPEPDTWQARRAELSQLKNNALKAMINGMIENGAEVDYPEKENKSNFVECIINAEKKAENAAK